MFNDGSAVLGSSTGHHMPRWDEVGQRLGEALQSHNMPVRPIEQTSCGGHVMNESLRQCNVCGVRADVLVCDG